MDHLERITLEPDKRAGKPCIRGFRITVYDVLEYLASGMTEEEILADFPDLEPEDIRAVLAFAAARERRLVEDRDNAAIAGGGDHPDGPGAAGGWGAR